MQDSVFWGVALCEPLAAGSLNAAQCCEELGDGPSSQEMHRKACQGIKPDVHILPKNYCSFIQQSGKSARSCSRQDAGRHRAAPAALVAPAASAPVPPASS